MRVFILLALLVGVVVAHDTGVPHDHPHDKKDGKGTRHFGNFGKPLGQHEPTKCETADDCPPGFLCKAQDDQPVGGASLAIVTMPKVCERPAASNPFYGGLLGALKGKKGDGKKDHDHKDRDKKKKKGGHDWHKESKDLSPCKEASEKLCGKCDKDKACWEKCMTENKAALEKACGKKKDHDHKDWKDWKDKKGGKDHKGKRGGKHDRDGDHGHRRDGKHDHHWGGKNMRSVQGTIKACGCTCQCSGFLCSEASKAKGLCSEATSHGITNGEACSKAQGTLNSLAHGLAKLSGCTGTFNTGGEAWTFTPKEEKKPLAGSIGPAWTYDETVEKPAGKKDMGGWQKLYYTEEQQARLGVDEEGKPVPKQEEEDTKKPKPLIGGGAGSIGPAWTYDETVEKPAGEKDMGGWTARVYTSEQQARLGVDETGAPVEKPAEEPASEHEHEHGEGKDGKKKHGCWLTKHIRRNRALCAAVGILVCVIVAACCVRCRRRRAARAALAARRGQGQGGSVPVGTVVREGKVVGMVPVAPIPVSSRNVVLQKEYLVEMASTSQQPAEEAEAGLPITLGQVVET